MARKHELCSSLCSCPLLVQMQENFVKKFRVFPNSSGGISSPIEASSSNNNNYKDALNVLKDDKNDRKDDNLQQAEINDLWHSFDEITNKNEQNDDEKIESLDYEIVDEESKTPLPVYETLSELELNSELAKYGHGPMGKRAAIRLLNQIFEATHPVFSETTPIPRKIIRLLEIDKQENTNGNLQRQKRTKAKIALLMGLDKEIDWKDKNIESIQILPKNDQKSCEEKKKQLKQTFLSWLRKPNNAKLYNEILTLNPVLLEKLYTSFRQDLEDTRGVSKEALANILDEMGITYGLKNIEEY